MATNKDEDARERAAREAEQKKRDAERKARDDKAREAEEPAPEGVDVSPPDTGAPSVMQDVEGRPVVGSDVPTEDRARVTTTSKLENPDPNTDSTGFEVDWRSLTGRFESASAAGAALDDEKTEVEKNDVILNHLRAGANREFVARISGMPIPDEFADKPAPQPAPLGNAGNLA